MTFLLHKKEGRPSILSIFCLFSVFFLFLSIYFLDAVLLSHVYHAVGWHIGIRMSFRKRNGLHPPARARKDVSEADDVAACLLLLQEDVEASLYRLALPARKLLFQHGLGFVPPVGASLANENASNVWMRDVLGLSRGMFSWLHRCRQMAKRLGFGRENNVRPTVCRLTTSRRGRARSVLRRWQRPGRSRSPTEGCLLGRIGSARPLE